MFQPRKMSTLPRFFIERIMVSRLSQGHDIESGLITTDSVLNEQKALKSGKRVFHRTPVPVQAGGPPFPHGIASTESSIESRVALAKEVQTQVILSLGIAAERLKLTIAGLLSDLHGDARSSLQHAIANIVGSIIRRVEAELDHHLLIQTDDEQSEMIRSIAISHVNRLVRKLLDQ